MAVKGSMPYKTKIKEGTFERKGTYGVQINTGGPSAALSDVWRLVLAISW